MIFIQQVWIMNQGGIVMEATPAEVRADAGIREMYFGRMEGARHA